MYEVKIFEVRDSMTFIPAIGIRLTAPLPPSPNTQEEWLIRRGGYAEEGAVLFARLIGGGGEVDPYNWPSGTRTMPVAHQYVSDHWKELKSGDVIDVEFILGIRKEPKKTERFEE